VRTVKFLSRWSVREVRSPGSAALFPERRRQGYALANECRGRDRYPSWLKITGTTKGPSRSWGQFRSEETRWPKGEPNDQPVLKVQLGFATKLRGTGAKSLESSRPQ
jgi:hypothetical protein